MTNIRIGFGYDVHQLKDNLPFLIGGVELNHSKGILAHSDGDIVFHSIADALLGASGLGDIGHFFPDTDPQYKGFDSSIILNEVMLKLKQLSYIIVNIDVSIVLEKPKLSAVISEVKLSISKCLKIDVSQINIKATTSERMGFIGKEQGIACYTVVLIEKI